MSGRKVIEKMISYMFMAAMVIGLLVGTGVVANAAAKEYTGTFVFEGARTFDFTGSSQSGKVELLAGDIIKPYSVISRSSSCTSGDELTIVVGETTVKLGATNPDAKFEITQKPYKVVSYALNEGKIKGEYTLTLSDDVDPITPGGGSESTISEAAQAVIDKIDAIGTVEYTDACKKKIDDARKSYDALTADQKEEVTNYSKLTDAEKKYDELAKEAATKQGTEIKDKDGKDTGYVVSGGSGNNLEAEYKGNAIDKSSKKVRILDEVVDGNGNVFKVTSIADNALKNYKGNELIIGKNIKKIGKRALKGSRFKKITIKTTKKGKIKIGKKAFRVGNKKCVIKIKGAKGKYRTKLVNKIKEQVPEGVTVK